MENPISSGLRTTFLIHAILAFVLGLSYLLIPDTVGGMLSWNMSDPAYRLIGALLVAIGASSWLAYKASVWSEVKIVVQFELVWTVLGAIVMAWMLLTNAVPAAGWLNFALLVIFAVVFGYFYSRN